MENLILYFSLRYGGDYRKIYNAFLRKEKVDEKLMESLFDKLKEMKCKYATIFSDDYPSQLKTIDNPPFVIYYYGDLSLIQTKVLGITGTREPSEYGKMATEKLVKESVKNNYTIINGMEKGIDSLVLRNTIKNNGKSIVVLGTGIDCCLSQENELYHELKQNHLIMSEFPFAESLSKELSLFRSRIIAGLLKGILVIEAKETSNTMLTVCYALEQGKEIFAVPTDIFSDKNGCNKIIQNGANLVLNINDIINTDF